MIKRYFYLSIVIIIMVSSISCKKDELTPVSKSETLIIKSQTILEQKQSEAIHWFEHEFMVTLNPALAILENPETVLLNFDKSASWKNPRSYTRDGLIITEGDIEVSGHWASFYPDPNGSKKKGELFKGDPRYLLPDIRAIIIDNGLEKMTEIMYVVPEIKYLDLKPKHVKSENTFFEVDKKFDGQIMFFTWEGTFKRGFVFKNGKIEAIIKDIALEKPTGGFRYCYYGYTITSYDTYGSAWVGDNSYWVYNGGYYTGTSYYSSWGLICDNVDPYSQFYGGCQYGCGGASATTTTTPTYSDDDLYDGIDPVELLKYPKFKCLYEKFIKGSYSLFNNTIGAFGTATDNVTFKYTDGGSRTDASMYRSTGNQDIYINVNHNSLEIAHDILHEGIHAAINAYLIHKGVVDVYLKNYEEVLTLYAQNKKGENIWYSHETYIGNNYIESIGNTLAQLDGYKYPNYYYWGVAYEGLSGHIDNAIDQNRDYYGSYQKIKDKYGKYAQYSNTVKFNSTLCQ